MISTNAIGTTGGLDILWNPSSVLMENFFTTRWTILAEYRIIGSNRQGFITNIYGPASQREKITLIHNLEGISTLTTNHRWILGKDFNMIYNLEDKRRGVHILEAECGNFQSLIDKMGLIALKTQNDLYT
jgi:hypothetical protein